MLSITEIPSVTRNDGHFWYVDDIDGDIVKPGDDVIIHELVGERFGAYNHQANLGQKATFLGSFIDPRDVVAFSKRSPELFENLDVGDIEQNFSCPYLKTTLKNLGTITMNGGECFWGRPPLVASYYRSKQFFKYLIQKTED